MNNKKWVLCFISLILFFTNVSAQEQYTEKYWEEFMLNAAIAQYVYNQEGTPKDFKAKEKANYQAGAEKGNLFCNYVLGLIFRQEGNHNEAFKYFSDMSKATAGPADLFIADMYCTGKGVAIDYDKAIFHFKRAIYSNMDLKTRSRAALNLSTVYYDKHKDDRPKIARIDSTEMQESRMCTAWLYVAHWMQPAEVTTKGTLLTASKTSTTAELIANIERSNDTRVINGIVNQAIGICNGIPGCKK